MIAQTAHETSDMQLISPFNKSCTQKGLVSLRDDLRSKIDEKETYANLEKQYGVNRFYLWKIIHNPDYTPPVNVLRTLGIGVVSQVVVVFGEVPPGAQVIAAQICTCGQWFVSNHPARKRCFICSPFRKSK